MTKETLSELYQVDFKIMTSEMCIRDRPQGDTVPLTALNAQKEPAEVAAPYDPQRIAVLDMATLTSLDYLQTTSAARCPAWAPSKRPAWRPSWPVAPT